MRILHIIDSGGMYGAEVMLLNLVEEQIQQGLKPVIASIGCHRCGKKAIETEARNCNFPVKIFRMHPGPNFFGAWKILQYARSINCNLLHSHGYKGDILLGLLPKIMRKIPLVSTAHGWTSTVGFSKLKIYEWLDRISLHFADAVVLVNKEMLNLPFFKGNFSGRIHVIDNGIAEKPRCGPQLRGDIKSFCEGNNVIGAIGRLSDEKGFSYLIDALSEINKTQADVRLLVLGEGPQRELLERKIYKLGIADLVYMPGFVQGASSYLTLFDVLVLPSVSEGLPLTLLEGMREGVPVVASAVGGIPDALDAGKCGVLVPPGNIGCLADALLDTLSPGGAAALLAKQGRKRFADLYGSARMCKEYAVLYKELLAI